jgi:hypothetical protein
VGRQNMLAAPPRRPWKIHPIWRGFGCLILLIAPVIAYAGAEVLLQLNGEFRWFPAPAELMVPVRIPGLEITIDHLWATAIIGVGLLLLGFALLIVFYGIIYSLIGPSRYGPLDADPHKDMPRRPHRKR